MSVGAGDNGISGCQLHGRHAEHAALGRLLEGARAGNSSVLVIRGEPGIGKTALLDYTASRAEGFRVVRTWGIESEMELPYAALHQLCLPLLDRLKELPGPQGDALEVAFGLKEGLAPNRFLTGLGVLGLLADAARERPLACLVDDAQWLDQSTMQALALAARRLMAEPVAVIFAVREPSTGLELAGLPDLVVTGLSDADARALLTAAVHSRLDPQVINRIVAEAHGNPLALLQLPRTLSPAELAGGFWLPVAGAWPSLTSRIEDSFQRQLQSLPHPRRQLLLTAAAEPTGDVPLLWRAAARQAIPPDAAASAEEAGLVEISAQVRFRHPLVRSAVYQAASVADRRAAHRALAEATDPDADPDRRAWQRAHAAALPDEDLAAELERSAERGQARGGAAAAAAFLQKAGELTPAPARRALRMLAAARAKYAAGAPDAAYRLLAAAEAGPLDELHQALLERLRARLAFSQGCSSQAPPLLLEAARRLTPHDAGLARDTYLEALGTAVHVGRLGEGTGLREVAEAARTAPAAPRPPRVVDALLDGLAIRLTDGYAAGLGPLRHALRMLRQGAGDIDWRWLWVVCPVMPEPVAVDTWDDDAWYEVADRALTLARDAGALSVLPMALGYRACAQLLAAELSTAAVLVDEAKAIAEATGSGPVGDLRPLLLAWRGQEAQALEVIEARIKDGIARGEGRAIGIAEHATALLYNGLGHYETAPSAAERGCQYEDLAYYSWTLIELVEAAARSGRRETAAAALRALTQRTRASGTDWALGIEARSRALLAEGTAADASYQEAIDRLSRTHITMHLARARLLYGEWLRRGNRRQDARESLRAAHDLFSRAGAAGFAERARRELMATGETVRKRTEATLADLTAQEAEIARLAGAGRSNHEIAAELFISPRTVEWHLGNVFTKLGITSRKDIV